ncbi:MAG: hypothetical protein DRN21_02630 [Thermoplasmata archaeon]|nr:MAG: DUF2240 family protein [Thermoplasmata archaeon]RLF33407.1 MAG: hypothetical protein DRN07_02675 [Thermoplasmata archaeon]RLF40180.1 MAG: hypothetical protein DRN21_02630 [Thermoplasmata archaeon]
MNELKTLVAFVFQRSGKEKMKEKDFYMLLSFELGWLTPGEGLKVIEKAIEENLMERENGELRPTFDHKSEEIPLGFTFNREMLGEMEGDLFTRICAKIVNDGGTGEKKVRGEIQRMAERLHVYPEVAALVVARKNNIDIGEFMDEAKRFVEES